MRRALRAPNLSQGRAANRLRCGGPSPVSSLNGAVAYLLVRRRRAAPTGRATVIPDPRRCSSTRVYTGTGSPTFSKLRRPRSSSVNAPPTRAAVAPLLIRIAPSCAEATRLAEDSAKCQFGRGRGPTDPSSQRGTDSSNPFPRWRPTIPVCAQPVIAMSPARPWFTITDDLRNSRRPAVRHTFNARRQGPGAFRPGG